MEVSNLALRRENKRIFQKKLLLPWVTTVSQEKRKEKEKKKSINQRLKKSKRKEKNNQSKIGEKKKKKKRNKEKRNKEKRYKEFLCTRQCLKQCAELSKAKRKKIVTITWLKPKGCMKQSPFWLPTKSLCLLFLRVEPKRKKKKKKTEKKKKEKAKTPKSQSSHQNPAF